MADNTPDHAQTPAQCPVTLEDVDLFAPGAQEYWYEAYEILHQHAPVHRIEGAGVVPGSDAYILTKHDDIARVVRDWERYPPLTSSILKNLAESGEDVAAMPGINTMVASMVTLRPDPPLWRSHRQELTDPWVGPGAGRNTEMVTRFAHQLVDAFIDEGRVDFVGDFAQPLPQMVMAAVLGWPLEDLGELKRFGDACVKPFVYGDGLRNSLPQDEVASQFAVLEEFKAYTQKLIEERRVAPREDMISFLTDVTYSPLDRKLTDLEINGIVYAMVIGGLETTQYALAEQMQLLCEHPDTWAELKADRSKIRAFTEEGMRLRAPTQGLSTRATTRDEVFQGVTVPAGSLLHMRWAAANIDPDEWECPHELRLNRKAGTRHLTFSQGPRVCPGASLSRLEQTIAWEILLERLASVRYADGNTFLHQPGIMLGTLELHIEFERA